MLAYGRSRNTVSAMPAVVVAHHLPSHVDPHGEVVARARRHRNHDEATVYRGERRRGVIVPRGAVADSGQEGLRGAPVGQG